MKQINILNLMSLIKDHLNIEDSAYLYSNIIFLLDKKTHMDKMWNILSQKILKPYWSLELHKLVFEFVYANWNQEKQGPPPIWIPTKEYIERNNIFQLLKQSGYCKYDEYYQWSIEHEILYVEKIIQDQEIIFDTPYSETFIKTNDMSKPKWLYGAKLNIYNSIFNKKYLENVALIVSKDGHSVENITFSSLKFLVDSFAKNLLALNIVPGDIIAICATHTVESIAIFLAAIKCGCVVSCILNNLALHEIETRLKVAIPKLIFTDDLLQSGDTETAYTKLKHICPDKLVVISYRLQEKNHQGMNWNTFLNLKSSQNELTFSYSIDATVFICFSSGTTAEPKGIPITHEMILANADYRIPTDQVTYWPTNLGWIVGTRSLLSTTLNHSPLALYYLGPKDSSFSKFIAKAPIHRLGTYPRIQKFWRENDSLNIDDLKQVQCIFSTGESGAYDDQFDLIRRTSYKPLLESCGATELGKGYLCSIPIRPIALGYFNAKVFGRDIVLVNQNNAISKNIAEVMLKSHHFGMSRNTLNYCHDKIYFKQNLKRDKNFSKQLRKVGDCVEVLSGNFYKMLGRTDDTLNIGGALYNPRSVEQNVNKLSFVLDSAAINVFRKSERVLLILYIIFRENVNIPLSLNAYIQTYLKNELDSNLILHDIVESTHLPYTSTGKLQRNKLRNMYYQTKYSDLQKNGQKDQI